MLQCMSVVEKLNEKLRRGVIWVVMGVLLGEIRHIIWLRA